MSKKCDITIGRDLTINTGNYSSIKPSVSVTIKDIDDENIENEYKRLSELVDSLIALEITNMGNEMKTINDIGYKAYIETIEKHRKSIENDLKTFARKGII